MSRASDTFCKLPLCLYNKNDSRDFSSVTQNFCPQKVIFLLGLLGSNYQDVGLMHLQKPSSKVNVTMLITDTFQCPGPVL